MGATQSNAKYGGKRQSSRGSVDNKSRLDAFTRGRSKGSADWETCEAEQLKAVVTRITQMGGAVTFGLSRDEGAHMVTLLLDDSKATMWYNGDADLSESLQEVLNTLKAIE